MAMNVFDWDIILSLSRLRGWRVVNAEDADGRMTQCILLPMDVNGIMLSQSKGLPFMRFFAPPRADNGDNKRDGYFRILVPTISLNTHQELVEKGLLSENEKSWSNWCGGIRPASFAREKMDRNKISENYL